MARKLLALLAGVLTAIIVIGIIEYIAHLLYAPTVPPDRSNPEAMRAFIAAMPAGAFLLILLAYAAGTFVGGVVAGRIARSTAWRHAGSIGGLILLFALMNIVVLPHPLWFTVSAIIVMPLMAALARAVGVPKSSA